SGTVVDKKGEVLEGAQVTLAAPAAVVGGAQYGSNGQVEFRGLMPELYKHTVTAAGMTPFTSPHIPLRAGQVRILPPVILSVSPVTTTVTVTGNSAQLSVEQLHIAEQQRIAGIIPNFSVRTTGTHRRC